MYVCSANPREGGGGKVNKQTIQSASFFFSLSFSFSVMFISGPQGRGWSKRGEGEQEKPEIFLNLYD